MALVQMAQRSRGKSTKKPAKRRRTIIHPSEIKDFEAAIVQAGFDVTDFNARQLLHLPGTKEVMPDIETVVVRRISTDIAIKYQCEMPSEWWNHFEADLHEGKFGQP